MLNLFKSIIKIIINKDINGKIVRIKFAYFKYLNRNSVIIWEDN
jgi:hypothetical protein